MSLQLIWHNSIGNSFKTFEYSIGECKLEELIINCVGEGSRSLFVTVEFLELGTDHHPDFLIKKIVDGDIATYFNKIFVLNGQVITLPLDFEFVRDDKLKYRLGGYDAFSNCFVNYLLKFQSDVK